MLTILHMSFSVYVILWIAMWIVLSKTNDLDRPDDHFVVKGPKQRLKDLKPTI